MIASSRMCAQGQAGYGLVAVAMLFLAVSHDLSWCVEHLCWLKPIAHTADKCPLNISCVQATVRPARNGVYKSGSAGEVNFNGDLARPILDGISMQWEALFGTTIIEHLKCVLSYSSSV